MTTKKIAITTLGCRANQYDSAAMTGLLLRAGWDRVAFDQAADAYLINTCAVTNKADAEARRLIRQAHRRNPEALVLVTGCYAQTDPKALAGVEGVSFILGNDQKASLLDYLSREAPLKPEIVVNDLFKEDFLFTSEFAVHGDRSRAYVKIQDGCNQMCSYCVIPFARGKNRSLDPEKVIEELRRLSGQGFHEAVLTGIHLGTYGRDLHPSTTLLGLMRKIEEARPIHRIRLSSIDPEEVEPEMIGFLKESRIFCAYLHIPVQSGDDQILKLMRRRYTAVEFCDLAVRLKEEIPSICLGTDVMVGFPYEDEDRFEASYRLIQESPLDYLHVFPYSPKKKTRAASFLSQISPGDKKTRVKRMTDLSHQKRAEFFKKAVGSEVEVVLEDEDLERPGFQKGLSRNYLPVYFPTPAAPFASKSLLRCRVNRYEGGQVFGEIVEG